MTEKFNNNSKVEKFTNMLGIAVRLIVIDPFSLYIDYMYTCISFFFFRKYSYTLAFEFDRKHYFSVYFY